MNQPNNKMPKETAIYIHIPFCEHKCIYCDFYSIITKDNIASFLHMLEREINYYADLYSPDRIVHPFFWREPLLMSPVSFMK
jgi:oxygen-independent coproporphyrinogen-3 oxidase